jgi:hypothetical protein
LAPMTFLSAGAPTTFLAMGTQYPRTMRRRHRRPYTFTFRYCFSLSAQVGKRQVANATCRDEFYDVVNALRLKGLPGCAE